MRWTALLRPDAKLGLMNLGAQCLGLLSLDAAHVSEGGRGRNLGTPEQSVQPNQRRLCTRMKPNNAL